MQRTGFQGLNVRSRLAIGIALCFLWLAVLQCVNLYALWVTQAHLAEARAQDVAVLQRMAELAALGSQAYGSVGTEWSTSAASEADSTSTQLLSVFDAVDQGAESLSQLLSAPEERAALEDFRFAWASYRSELQDAGSRVEQLPATASLVEYGLSASSRLRSLQLLVASRVEVELAAAAAQRVTAQRAVAVLLIVAVCPALLLALHLVRRTVSDVETLQRVAALAAEGEARQGVETEAINELHGLARSLNLVIRRQKRLTAAHRESLEQVEREMKERRRLEASRSLVERRYETLVDWVAEGIITTDAEERVVSFNHGAEVLTEWTPQQAIGKPIASILRGPDGQYTNAVLIAVRRVLDSGQSSALNESFELLGKNGARRLITSQTMPLHDVDDSVIGALILFRDTAPGES